jgi:hypothetical protein
LHSFHKNIYFFVFFSPDIVKSNSNIIAPKSLREWHEEPANLIEQPPLTEKVNVQILSPNIDRVNQLDFFFHMKTFFLDTSFFC